MIVTAALELDQHISINTSKLHGTSSLTVETDSDIRSNHALFTAIAVFSDT